MRAFVSFVTSVAFVGLAACSASPSQQAGSAAGGATGSTSTGTGNSGAHDDCATLCANEAKTCPKTVVSECVTSCEFNKSEVTWCTGPATAATDCLAKQPASSFQCDMNGLPVTKSGVCAAELGDLATCWDDGPEAGLPDLSGACSTACGKEASLSCADPNCTSGCEASIAPSAKCHGAFAALVACAAKQDASKFACDMEMPPRAGPTAGVCAFESLLLYNCLQAP